MCRWYCGDTRIDGTLLFDKRKLLLLYKQQMRQVGQLWESGGVVLLSEQEAHTQRVLLGRIWSQSIRAAGHMILFLQKPINKRYSDYSTHFLQKLCLWLQFLPEESDQMWWHQDRCESKFIFGIFWGNLSGWWTYGTAPARLCRDLRVGIDAFELGQSLLLDLLQVLFQRQISICEEPGEQFKEEELYVFNQPLCQNMWGTFHKFFHK